MKVFVTKYALTSGVEEKEVEPSLRDPRYVYTQDGYYACFGPGQWFATREEAVKVAYRLRDKKIASLEKQHRKMLAMTFE